MQIQQNQARNQTEAQVAALLNEILSVYDDARKDINAELRKIYATVLSGVKPEDYYNTIIKYDRLNKLLKEIDSLYIEQSVKAGKMTAESSRLAINNAYYKNEFVLKWFTPNVDIDLNFVALPAALVELSVTGNLTKWQELGAKVQQRIEKAFGTVSAYAPQSGTLSSLLVNNRRDEVLKINRAITSGLLQGNSYQKTSRAVSKVIGAVTPKGSTGAKSSAIRIVRTESNRTYNAGAYANTQAVASQGVNVMRTVLATLDMRTRPQSIAIDGQTVGHDEPFIYPGGVEVMYPGNSGVARWDINDRETVLDTIDGIPPKARIGVDPIASEKETEKLRQEAIRDGKDPKKVQPVEVTKVFSWQTYPEWAKSHGLTEKPSGKWS